MPVYLLLLLLLELEKCVQEGEGGGERGREGRKEWGAAARGPGLEEENVASHRAMPRLVEPLEHPSRAQ